jgi:hypothetical protein
MAFLASIGHRGDDHGGQLRVVHHAVLAVRPVHADHFDDRVERGHYLAETGTAPGICQGSVNVEGERARIGTT